MEYMTWNRSLSRSYGSTRRLGYVYSTRVLIYRILGTPDEDNWPGVTSLPDYKTTFPQWAGVPLPSHIRGLDADGLELLTSMLIYDPAHRMSGESSFFFLDSPSSFSSSLLYCFTGCKWESGSEDRGDGHRGVGEDKIWIKG